MKIEMLTFNLPNYDDAIIENKNQLSDYLYAKAKRSI